ncbi:MAG: hypothetical protein EAZ55_03715 [Cytophagales bacterium]|nr:MAG: hypothetical protein EAZ55_03715 [Cytophagales bacterium]
MELYKRSDANVDFATDLQSLAINEGIGLRSFMTAWKYLHMEELIKIRPMSSYGSFQGNPHYYASITHKGIKAIEDVYNNDQEPTYYFPPYREMIF